MCIVRTVALALLLAAPLAAAEAPRPPHLLLLVAEDLSPRIGAFGDPVARTPHLDRLASEGVRFTRVFTTAGVCAPSRAALVTGRHQIAIGAQHMRTSTRPAGAYRTVPPPDVKAFPELLRAAGYYTFTDSKHDYQFSGPLGDAPFTIWDDSGRSAHWRGRPDPDQPFFGLVNFGETHESGLFPPLLSGWPRSFLHVALALLRRLQYGAVPRITDPSAVALPPYYPDTPTVRRDVARHYDDVHAMDAAVGRWLAELEADGLADSTIVVWTTDHGDGLPRAKRELYDSGLHVPLIVRFPEALRPDHLPSGGRDERLVSFVDLAPTLLRLAGAPRPAGLSPHDFLDPDAPRRRYVYAARDRIDEVWDRERAVRDERFKYIRSFAPDRPTGHRLAFRDHLAMMRELWALRAEGALDPVQSRWFEPTGAERLYDLAEDPHEVADVSGEPGYADALERMRAAYAGFAARVRDTSEEPEDRMVERFWPGGEAPVTPAPVLERSAGGRVVVRSDTPGASLGYRIDGGPWQLYVGPVPLATGSRLEARAVRYGWDASEVVALEGA